MSEEGVVDLSGLESTIKRQDEGIEIKLVSLDGKTPLGVSIWAVGPDSKQAAEARQQLHEELVAAQSSETDKPIFNEEFSARLMAKLTLRWSPDILLAGERRSFSEENAYLLYKTFRFIRQQVDVGSSRTAFFKAS